jgi:hypothetical protein
MKRPRCGCAVASIEKTFYVFGGINNHNLLNETTPEETSQATSSSVETFTMGDKEWTSLPNSKMNQPRWYGSAVSFPLHKDIVVLGGRDPTQWNELSSVEAFNTTTKEWTQLANMSRPRFGCGATRISESILLVLGGYDGIEWSSTCEMYDYAENHWTAISSMPIEGLQFVTATTLNDDMVVVSGQASDVTAETGSTLMLYHISQDSWTTLPIFPPSLAEELSGSSVVAVGGKYLLSVGGTDPDGLATKNTRISTNLTTVITAAVNGVPFNKLDSDNMTVTTYSSTVTPSVVPSSVSVDDVGSHPLWASPTGTSKPTLNGSASSIAPMSHISINNEMVASAICGDRSTLSHSTSSTSDEYSVYEDDSERVDDTMVSPATRSRKKAAAASKRQVVENYPTVDANDNAVVYTGSVLNGRPSGKGRMRWAKNGEMYVGGFKQGQRHGKGCHTYSNGRQYEGRFVNDYAHDPNGTMKWKDGALFIGAFVEGRRTGSGIQRFPSGVRYEGDFLNGKYHGRGLCCFADGSLYSGEFMDGKAHGQGVLKDKYGKVLYNGLWQNDSPVPQ